MKSNGDSKCSKSRLFCCLCNHAYIPSIQDERGPYHISTLHYDALNSRGHDGWALSRRTKTMKQFSDEECCHFQFYVKWDFIGIYLHYGVGSGFLNSHPKSISDDMLFSSRLICNAKQDVLRKLGHSYTNCCTSVPAGTTINFTRECSLVLVLLTMWRGIFFFLIHRWSFDTAVAEHQNAIMPLSQWTSNVILCLLGCTPGLFLQVMQKGYRRLFAGELPRSNKNYVSS